MNRVTFASALALAAALCGREQAFAQDPPDRPKVIYSSIVLTGDPAPDAGGSFTAFPYHNVINDQSEIVFLGDTQSPAAEGLFLAASTGVQQVAHAGQAAPGFDSGVEIQGFDPNYHRANNKGQVVFESTLAGPGIASTGDDDTNAFANWFWSAGKLQPVAQFQAPAPGTTALFRTFGRTTINDLGHVAFSGDLTGAGVTPANDTAFWYGAPGAVTLLAREGSPGPGGVTYGNMTGFDYPFLSANGHVAFMTDLPGNARALFGGTADQLQLIAKTNDPVPGTTVQYGRIEGHGTPPRINNNGVVEFVSFLSDGSRGLLVGNEQAMKIVARTGQSAPELGDAKFDFFFDYGLNDAGQIAFRAETRLPGAAEVGSAIYAGAPDAFKLIAADGQQAPGVEDGVNFWYFHDPVINRDGQVAFFATLTGPAARGPDDYGLFATGHAGDLRLIARFGDQFEVAPGDMRTIQAMSHAGVYGTHIVTFNEQSDLSMLIRFTDGSEGIFTARVLPEPGAATLALLAAAAVLLRHRRYLPLCPSG